MNAAARHLFHLLLLEIGSLVFCAPLFGQPAAAQRGPGPACPMMELYLAVSINGRASDKIGHFSYCPARDALSATRAVLDDIGLRLPAGTAMGGQRGMIPLDRLPGLSWRYDSAGQTVDLSVPDVLLKPEIISAFHVDPAAAAAPESGPDRSWGAVLNYSLQASAHLGSGTTGSRFDGAAASLDGWIYSPFGTLGSTGFSRFDSNLSHAKVLRLESSFRHDFRTRMLTATLGDFQTSTFQWGRSIRMGGFQIRRNFALRDDLVPQQWFAFSGAAAVPSTVDVFIDNNRAFSTRVEPGPFRIEDIPTATGRGAAVIRIRQPDGREVTRRVSFFTARHLVKRGMLDFSLGVGYPREAYGIESNRYSGQPAYSTSLRYGLTDRLTLAAHVEGNDSLLMGTFGFTTTPFDLAETTFVLGASRHVGETGKFETGRFAYGSLRTRIWPAELNLSLLKSEKGFVDLAYVSGASYLGTATVQGTGSLLGFPRRQGVLGLTFPDSPILRNVGFSIVDSHRTNRKDLLIAASWSQQLGWQDSSLDFYATRDIHRGETRLALNLAFSWGGNHYAHASLDSGSAPNAGIYVSRPMSQRVGDYGYNLQARRRAGKPQLFAQAQYRARFGKIGAAVSRIGNFTYLRSHLDGSLVFAGGRLAAGNTIHDSFALVDVGVPGVPVSFQNRVVTTTGRSGKALVTGLSSYARNRISINPLDLPRGAVYGATAVDVVPARGAGGLARLKADTRPSLLLVLTDAKGHFLPLGTPVYLNGGRVPVFVAYDGQVWLQDIAPENNLRVVLPSGDCRLSFSSRKANGADLQPRRMECHK